MFVSRRRRGMLVVRDLDGQCLLCVSVGLMVVRVNDARCREEEEGGGGNDEENQVVLSSSSSGDCRSRFCFTADISSKIAPKKVPDLCSDIWQPGTLEEKVQHIVKTWEMEMFNKLNFDDYKTVDPIKYRFSLNGRKGITLEEKRKLGGGYNSFLQTSLPEEFRGYDPAKETVDSAHVAFTTAFPRGFALEIIEVYSGPPVITYKFRHWGFNEGPFKGHAPTGEMVELYGMSIFEVDENSKIIRVEFFFDRGELLGGLMKGSLTDGSTSAMNTSCPFLKNTG